MELKLVQKWPQNTSLLILIIKEEEFVKTDGLRQPFLEKKPCIFKIPKIFTCGWSLTPGTLTSPLPWKKVIQSGSLDHFGKSQRHLALYNAWKMVKSVKKLSAGYYRTPPPGW